MRKQVKSKKVKVKSLILLLLFSFYLLPSSAYSQNAMQSLAAGMAPGTWAAFNTGPTWDNGNILRAVGGCVGGTLADYSDKGGGWTSNGQIYAFGGIHFATDGIPNNCNASPFVRYTAATNTWDRLQSAWPTYDDAFICGVNQLCTSVTIPGTSGSTGHNYQHDTVVGIDMYHRQYNNVKIMKYTGATNSWSQCTPVPSANGSGEALEYFPERNSLVYIDGSYGVYELSIASNCTGAWTQRATNVTLAPMGATGTQARYSGGTGASACHCIVFSGGGGFRSMWKYNANGTFTAGANSPVDLNQPQANDGTIFTLDPVTGKILVWFWQTAKNTMYEYDPVANSWNTISRTAPSDLFYLTGVEDVFSWPIDTYGVIMFTFTYPCYGCPSSVYLYKHAAGVADTTAPSVPGIATGTPIGSSQINLSWAASSDPESGVSSYQVDRRIGAAGTFTQIATPTTNALNDTKLTPQTTYNYRIRAVNGQGLISGNSAIASATTGVADTVAPVVAVTDPPNTTPVSAGTAGSYNVVGTATDNIGVVTITLVNDRGGSYTVNTSGTSVSWNRAVNLFNGTNVITTTAQDAEGNNSTAVVRTITTTIVGPSLTPSPTATSPGATVNVAFTGVASPTTRDWMGLYPVGAPDAFNPAYPWVYTYGTPSCTSATIARSTTVPPAVTSGSCNFTMPATAGSYNFRMFSDDAETNPLAVTATVTSTAVVDTQAPSTPTGLNAIAINNTINLSWIASSDNSGTVTGYRVERSPAGCAAFVQVGTPSVNTYIDSGLAATTTYCYRVIATDAAGNLSPYSAIAQATTGTIAAGGGNFAQRCAAAGVLRCWGFDQNSDLAGYPTGDNSGSGNNSHDGIYFESNNYDGTCGTRHLWKCPQIDTSIKASGGGSMKFTMPAYGDPAGSGAGAAGFWVTNFSMGAAGGGGTYWGPTTGDDFYIQWRQRFDQNYVTYEYQYTSGAGPKHVDIAPQDLATCSFVNQADCRYSNIGMKIVVEDAARRSMPIMYGPQNGAGGGDDGYNVDIFTHSTTGFADYKMQNARVSPFCTHYYLPDGTALSTGPGSNARLREPPTGNCVGYFPNEWMTYKIHVRLGPKILMGGTWVFSASTLEMFIGREGQALELVSRGTNVNFDISSGGNDTFGKLWVMPYMTGKSDNEDPLLPGFNTWWDELIISRNDIADPGTGTPTGPGITITSPTSNPTTTVNTATISLGGTVQ